MQISDLDPVSPTLIPMADQPSSSAAKKSKKKGGGVGKLFQNLVTNKRPKSESATQSNSTQVSVSAFGAHDPVPKNDVAEPTASSKC